MQNSTKIQTIAKLSIVCFAGLLCACTSSPNQCTPEPPAACTPSINIDFNSLYTNVFSQRCASNGCHGAMTTQGNLVMADPDSAYKALLGMDGTEARVISGDPSCSVLVQRIDTDDTQKRMPLGEPNKLADGLRCAVRMWIEAGAAR